MDFKRSISSCARTCTIVGFLTASRMRTAWVYASTLPVVSIVTCLSSDYCAGFSFGTDLENLTVAEAASRYLYAELGRTDAWQQTVSFQTLSSRSELLFLLHSLNVPYTLQIKPDIFPNQHIYDVALVFPANAC